MIVIIVNGNNSCFMALFQDSLGDTLTLYCHFPFQNSFDRPE